jgi:hypothetical protein
MAVLTVHAILVVFSKLVVAGALVGDAKVVAAVATLLAGNKGGGLFVRKLGKGGNRQQAKGVFAAHVLFSLFFVTFLTCGDGGQFDLVHVIGTHVTTAMTGLTGQFLGHFAPVEVLDQTGIQLDMTLFTLGRLTPCRWQGQTQ